MPIKEDSQDEKIPTSCQPSFEQHEDGGKDGDQADCAAIHWKLGKSARAFRMLTNCTQAMLSAGDEISLLQSLCRILVKSGGYAMVWVGYAENDSARTIRPVARAGEGTEFLCSQGFGWGDDDPGRGPPGIAIRTGEPHISRYVDVGSPPAAGTEAAIRCGCSSSLALPLYCDGGVLGILNVYSKEANAFDPEELSLLEDLAGNISFGIASIRMRLERQAAEEELRLSWERLGLTLEGTVRAMARVTELRDPYTAGHQQRVGELAGAIAGEMGLSLDDAEGIRIAGVLHDIGKAYVPIQILAKPGSLSPVEYNLVKVHSEAGYEILKNVEFPWPIAETVLQHHERLNGSGYPYSLANSEVILSARIIAVADTVEAMSNFRPYRPAYGIDAALNEVSKSNDLYDPLCAAACARLFRQGGFSWSSGNL